MPENTNNKNKPPLLISRDTEIEELRRPKVLAKNDKEKRKGKFWNFAVSKFETLTHRVSQNKVSSFLHKLHSKYTTTRYSSCLWLPLLLLSLVKKFKIQTKIPTSLTLSLSLCLRGEIHFTRTFSGSFSFSFSLMRRTKLGFPPFRLPSPGVHCATLALCRYHEGRKRNIEPCETSPSNAKYISAVGWSGKRSQPLRRNHRGNLFRLYKKWMREISD